MNFNCKKCHNKFSEKYNLFNFNWCIMHGESTCIFCIYKVFEKCKECYETICIDCEKIVHHNNKCIIKILCKKFDIIQHSLIDYNLIKIIKQYI